MRYYVFCFLFFFFKQKTAYDMLRSLVGSEMCIRDRYTNGLGIVEDLLSDTRITDVYINAPADTNPVHVVMDGEECASNVFLSQDDLDALVSRFRTISGRPFGEAIPVLELNLEAFGVRVSVIGAVSYTHLRAHE